MGLRAIVDPQSALLKLLRSCHGYLGRASDPDRPRLRKASHFLSQTASTAGTAVSRARGAIQFVWCEAHGAEVLVGGGAADGDEFGGDAEGDLAGGDGGDVEADG